MIAQINSLSALILRTGTLLLFATVISSCAFNPAQEVQKICPDCYPLLLAQNSEWPLLAYMRDPRNSAKEFIHIYFEGDGRPWIRGVQPATNPTSRELTVLRLMQLDPTPSVYINRPCYGHKKVPSNCRHFMWTNGRYGSQVVKALAEGLDEIAADYPAARFLLIGHSGGGTLAMLLAQERKDVAGIITLAANLNVDAWTEHFNYLPLDQSLNPALQPSLPPELPRWHFAAKEDQQVPASIIEEAVKEDEYAKFLVVDGDHHCCWQQYWPLIMAEMAESIGGN